MSRSQRLLALIHQLNSHRYPVTGRRLAEVLGISLRTLYRDIATLQAQGADIAGEPGVGYVLRPGFMLPPLMFSEQELEALVLGSRWVVKNADDELAEAARSALTRIASVLPPSRRDELEANGLLVAGPHERERETIDPALIRQAIRSEHKVMIRYRDAKGDETERMVWPIALGYFDRLRMLAGWCELRGAFRHFRTDRIAAFEMTPHRYPRRRKVLLQEWRIQDGPPRPD